MTDAYVRGLESSVRSTLLHRPPVPPDAVDRPDLVAAVEAGLLCSATLVAAPAGYGKSVLISQWCQQTRHLVVWLSLAPPVDDLRGFLRHLAAGVRALLDDALRATTRLVESGTEVSHGAAVTALSNDLVDVPDRLVVVLDDYHAVTNADVHEVVADLLRHPPESVHFMILTRRDPPLPIGSLRAGGRLSEFRLDDLRFTPEQSAQLVGRGLGRELAQPEKMSLDTATEGWAAGLRLAVHAMRHGPPAGAAFGAAYLDRGAQEYLIAEVLDQISPDVLRFLVAASYFDRFSAELCDAVVHTTDGDPTLTGHDFVEWLLQENLFVIPLDNDNRWFRFHHVFGRLLTEWRATHAARFELDEPELHRIAAKVLCDQHLVEEAIKELDLAGAHDELVELAAEYGNALIDEDCWGDLATLLGAVPTDLFERYADLLVLRAWLVGEHGGRYREMVEILDRADELLDHEPGSQKRLDDLRGKIAVLRGTYARLNRGDFDGALADARTARRLLAEPPGRITVQGCALAAIALANSGRYSEARREVDSVVGDERFADWPTDPMIWTRPMLGWVEGSLEMVERGGSQLLAAGEQHELRGYVAYGHYFLGACAYERNDLATAREHLTVAIDVDYTIIEQFLHSNVALALTELATGRPAEALNVSETMVRAMLDTRGDYNVPTANGALALVEARTGRQRAALGWARAADPDVPRPRYMFFDLTPALIEILLSSPTDVQRGRQLLDRALASSYGRFNRPVNIKLLGLAAIDAARTGDIEQALATLETAVLRAQEGGLVRSLADFGSELVSLLHRLEVDGALLDHVGQILRAIEQAETSVIDDRPAVHVVARVAGEPGLGLTQREIDVLRLLAERYSNKEIGRELLIAPATVKKHTVTLYDKLNVHGRREAVEKARALGYIAE